MNGDGSIARAASSYSIAAVVTPIICALVYLNLFLATLVSRALAWAADKPWYPWAPSTTHIRRDHPRIAIIGAGVSGVSAGAAAVQAGVDCVIFEKQDTIGGVWARVNKTSALQFQSLFYRFHPCVRFQSTFPKRDEILGELQRVWKLYALESRTRFGTPVENIVHDRHTDTYVINGRSDEPFDGVISAIGTCGDIKIPKFNGIEKYVGRKTHSSRLDDAKLDVHGSHSNANITILGSGASAVEIVDYILDKLDGVEEKLGMAEDKISITVIARSNKWIMPRGILLSGLASMIPSRIGYILEFFLRTSWYGHELQGMTPDKPFYASTPCLNTRYLALVRQGRIRYIRGAVKDFDTDSISVDSIKWDSQNINSPSSSPSSSLDIKSDFVFFATGFEKPIMPAPRNTFVAEDGVDKEDFHPPNLFCVAFPPAHPKILLLNSAYIDAVATAGHIHIGVLTRLFLTFILDPKTRPTEHDAAEWVRARRAPHLSPAEKQKQLEAFKSTTPGAKSILIGGYRRSTAGLDFYTYGELLFWVASVVATSSARWKYALFVAGFNNSKGAKLASKFALDHQVEGREARQGGPNGTSPLSVVKDD